MNSGNKVIAGILFAASIGFAAKAIKDYRDMKKDEEEIMSMAEEVFEDELQDETQD